jgi:membrane associated rhomboid family serine protease
VRRGFDTSQLRITRGCLILLFLELGLSMVWLMSDKSVRLDMAHYLAATPDGVWREGKVWTLVTAPLLEIRFISLIFQVLILWMFIPTLERFWGTGRFLRFAAMTSIAGTIGGTLVGLALGTNVAIAGLDSFVYASIVAFGIIYARQPVQFFGVLPLTGRQLMYGILGFLLLFIVLQQAWEEGAGFASSIALTALLTSQRWNPELVWQRWRRRRARRHLEVIRGGADRKRDEPKWMN